MTTVQNTESILEQHEYQIRRAQQASALFGKLMGMVSSKHPTSVTYSCICLQKQLKTLVKNRKKSIPALLTTPALPKDVIDYFVNQQNCYIDGLIELMTQLCGELQGQTFDDFKLFHKSADLLDKIQSLA